MNAAQDGRGERIVPSMVVTGDRDRVAEPDWHLPWIKAVFGPTRVVTVPGAGHAPHHVRPGLVVEAIRAAIRHRSR